MKRHAAIFIGIVAFMLPIILAQAEATIVAKLAPDKGKPGHSVNIIGDGFDACGPITANFGRGPLPTITQIGDKVIQFKVPNVSPGWYSVSIICDQQSLDAGTFEVIERQ